MTRRLHRSPLGRLFCSGLFALGCSDLLGIHDPLPRPPNADGGEAGEKPSTHPPAGGNAGGAAGEGGDPDSVPTAGDSGAHGGDAPLNGGEAGMAAGGGGTGGGAIGGWGGSGTAGGGTGGGGTAGGGTGGDLGGGGGGDGPGGGGSGGAPACSAAAPLRCDPASPKTPQVCSAGQWVLNTTQNNGLDCAVACNDGVCGECSNGDLSCQDNYPRTCVNGAWVKQPFSCPDMCINGACVAAPSCVGVAAPGSCNQESCCLSLEVTGNSFFRDGKTAYPATISSFTMDKYEVTVARLEQYMTWYFGPEGSAPVPGAGKSAHFAADPGWVSNYPLPARSAQGMQDMQDMLSCVATHGDPADPNATYVAANPLLPANCVSFYVAYALCIWDGGRLPTEAEWNFAATSSEQRTYPWSNPPSSTLIDATYTVYGKTSILPVGSLPAGRGPFGQFDLAGNVGEWTLDYFVPTYPAAIAQCNDCIDLSPASQRSVRGGSFQSNQFFVKTSARTSAVPDDHQAVVGFRCVHDL